VNREAKQNNNVWEEKRGGNMRISHIQMVTYRPYVFSSGKSFGGWGVVSWSLVFVINDGKTHSTCLLDIEIELKRRGKFLLGIGREEKSINA